MTRPAATGEAIARKRRAVLRAADATRAAKAAVRQGCEVEVRVGDDLRFLFRPLRKAASEPETNSWDGAEA